MARKHKSRVRESFTTAGTGSLTLLGAVGSATRSFGSVLSTGDVVPYVADKGAQWEEGEGTFTSPNTFARTTIFDNSLGGTSAIDFGSGTGEVFIDLPASWLDELDKTEVTVTCAATCDVGAVQAKFIVLSGTTGPVTSFGSTTVNKERWVRHSGETITHNATSLILIGGVDYVTSSNDVSLFKQNAAGNWREYLRRYADGRLVGLAIFPFANDGGALGSASLSWSDLFLASGGVINFSNGNVTVTHSTSTITMAGTPGAGQVLDFYVTNASDGYAGLNLRAGGKGWLLSKRVNSQSDILGLFSWDGTGFTINSTFTPGGGLQVGSPTGGDKGAGSINASALYDDNVLLTCPALAKEFIESGKIDTDKWDAMVPDRVLVPARIESERVEERPVTEPTGEYETKLIRQKDGTYLAQKTDTPILRTVMEWVPVYDDKGNGVDAVHEPVVERVVVPAVNEPAQTQKRRHDVAHLFKAMVDEGFDPRDPAAYIARLKKDQALPGMPTQDNWEHASLSVGEIHGRLWLASEMLALVIINLHERIVALEAAQARR